MSPQRVGSVRVLVLLGTLLALVLGLAPAASAGTFEERAQRRLNRLGCDAGPADGSIGPWTRSAIIRFQAANGLHQSGKLTKATRAKMYARRQVQCDHRPVVASGTGRLRGLRGGQLATRTVDPERPRMTCSLLGIRCRISST